MTNKDVFATEPRDFSPSLLHIAFFSVLFLMLASAWPSPSLSYGSCSGSVVAMEGPLLPVAV